MTQQLTTQNVPSPETSGVGPEPDVLTTKAQSQGRLVFNRFIRHRGAMIGLAILILAIILVYSSIGFAGLPGWWKWDYKDTAPILNGGHPTWKFPFSLGEHPFGQNSIGVDYFALTMRGAQQSIVVAFIAGVVSTVVGTVIGAVAGYFRGWTEAVLMRLTDVVITIPVIAIAATLGAKWGKSGVVVIGLVIGLVGWTSLARVVRGEFLLLREREFVDAARVGGASSARIIFRHIMPNTVGVIVVSATLTTATAILLETSLSYLGVGVRSPDTSLGLLITENQAAFSTRPWLFWWPGLFIIIIALTVNFIGDGLRDAYDPRQRVIPKVKWYKRILGRSAEERPESDIPEKPTGVPDSTSTPTGGAGGDEGPGDGPATPEQTPRS
ncbi:ABC transporter permease [Gordonia jinhuaensis]|uniref:ABC transporter permease n=1 Tax=Gordonia jinhuaensis TaxID=1517702 RepID=A0A916TB28_9ACTN|nr:ABC transporter permease [Gordonia jinhuaensis]GGB35736.1 ABC transporter permease [Gordonia jinhuaensis]